MPGLRPSPDVSTKRMSTVSLGMLIVVSVVAAALVAVQVI